MDRLLHSLFEERVKSDPDRIAISFGEESYTYEELNRLSNRYARYLIKEGVSKESFVGIYMNRSIEMVAAMLAVLKAGATYVPLDPKQPDKRINLIVEHSKMKYLVSDKATKGTITSVSREICFADFEKEIQELDVSDPNVQASPDQIAYTIFTSGSTGVPKGVMIRHSNVVAFVESMSKVLGVSKEDRVLAITTITFDISILEIFLTLAVGAQIIMTDYDTSVNAFMLERLCEEKHPTIMQATPATWYMLLDSTWKGSDDLQIICGGEYWGLALAEQLVDKCKKLWNAYGPTEATVWVSASQYHKGDSNINLGNPFEGTKMYILNEKLEPVPDGESGELYIAGSQVGAGYFNNPDKTKEAFIHTDKFEEGLLYKTGDRVRLNAEGKIEYIERVDFQVKIRGFRIELGDIENNALLIPEVKRAAAVVKTHKDDKAIALYVVGDQTKVDKKKILSELRENLPYYMIPQMIEFVDELPMNDNRKVDRKKLESLPIDLGSLCNEYVAPKTETEKKLCAIYCEVLDLEKVGAKDHFFESGGHSLRAIKLINGIEKEFHKRLTNKVIFENPIVEDLARYIDSMTEHTQDIIPIANKQDEYEMSSSEKRIYIVNELDETGLAYNIPEYYEVTGGLEKERFMDAVRKLVERHEPLRTSYHMRDGKAVKVIHDTVELPVEWITSEHFDKEVAKEFIKPFDFGTAPLFRMQVVLCPDKTYLLVDSSHIISDGTSAENFIKDLVALYKGEELVPLRVQYKDYSEWMRLVRKEELKEQEAYWLEQYKEEPPVLNLQTDFVRPAVQSFEGTIYARMADEKLCSKVANYAKEHDVTENMMLMGAFALLLSKYSGQDDIVIGTAIFGRTNYEEEKMMGVFINTLAIRNKVTHDMILSDYMKQTKECFVRAYDNQEYPFEDLVEKVVTRRDMSRNPLFDVMFSYYSEQENIIGVEKDGFIPVRFADAEKKAQFDITLSINRFPDTFEINFEYCTKIFKEESIKRLTNSYIRLLEQIVDDEDLTIRELSVVDPAEEEKLLKEFNGVAKDYDLGKTLYEKFEEYAVKQPDKTAVIFGDRKQTYKEVNEKANRIAHYLIKQGIQKDDVVGVLLERSPKFIESVLGIWKAGGAYMPLDSKHPVERKLGLLEDSKAFGMVTESAIAEPELIEHFGGKVLCLDEAKKILEKESVEDPMLASDIHQLAYVLFTSGSTGKPKGVMIEHLGMLNHIYAEADDLGLTDDLVFAQNANQCFDVSVWQFFGALALGGTTAIYSNDCILDIPEFISRLNEDKVNMLEVVPSYLSVVMDYVESEHLSIDNVKHLLVTGEAVKPEIVNRWFSLSDKQEIINAYGPAEASDDVVQAHITKPVETTTVPIGKPLPNVNIYILDQDRNLCPIGVEGEICIGGVGVGRGYVGNEEKTRESFVTIAVSGIEERIYKTGDKAKWAENGEIVFLGRDDFQVKIRGFRIELEEIEKQITNVNDLKEVVVVPVEKQLLAAYFVATREISAEEIKKQISEILPEYMVPAFYVQLDKMPLSSNGKIDRKALPKIDITECREYVEPENEIEKIICHIFEEILNTEKVGATDNFFELGGHSLRATRLINRMEVELGHRIVLKDVFKNATPRQLATLVMDGDTVGYVPIPKAEEKEYYPMSSTQKRTYLICQMDADGILYNMPEFRILKGNVNPDALKNALQKVFDRHEILRTQFLMVDGEPVQKILDHVEADFEFYQDITTPDEQLRNDFIRPFNLSKGPLIRVRLIDRGDHYLYCLDMHHIIGDGMTNDLFNKELSALYNGEELAPLTRQYKDYSEWMRTRDLSDQANFWKELFEDEIPVLDMPLDFARPQEQSYLGDMIYRPVGKELCVKIKELASKTGTTNFMVFMSAAMILLSKYSRQEDIVIGTPVSARVHKDTEEMFGMFVNTLAMRGKPESKKTYLEFLNEIKELSFKSFENQEFPFEELVEAVDVKRDLSRNPLFDVMLVLQNTENLNLAFHDVESRWMDCGSTVAQFDLCFSIEERSDDFMITLEYCTDLFTKDSAEEITAHFEMILEQLTMNPSVKIEDVATVDSKEKATIVNDFNNTLVHGLEEKTIVELFEEQVLKTPDQAAVIYKGQTLTYSELNARANALAYKLREVGVGRNDFVVLYTERSLEMIIGIYGIIKAGGAYVPMDPTYPEDRIAYMLEDAAPKAVLTYKTTIQTDIPVIDLADSRNYSDRIQNPEPVNTARDLIYCIYTSGTTGKPKGVMIEHGNLVNFISVDKMSEFQYSMKEMCTFVYSSNKVIFDITMQEIFLPICNGIGMILADNEWLQFSKEDMETIERNHGIGLITTPTKLRNCMLSDERNVLKKIDFYMIGAENLPLELIRSLRELNPKAVIYNGYGPTETTCGATYYLCNEDTKRILIGKPMANTQIYILNGETLCGIGVPGELCIAGAGVARGYVKLPEMTKEKFVENPFGEGRMYHTGDLARWLPDGNIEYLGRIDEQVKIRGFRIELGEIESRIREIENVKECAVIAREDSSGEKAIYAYIVGDKDISISDIRFNLSKNLPDYMIPAYMMQIESIPMTRNGKLDKRALPEIKGRAENEYVAPRNEMESLICKVYCEVLNLEKVGVRDSFFELGGHSLRVIKLINAIDRELGKRIAVKTVFGNPRVEELAHYLNAEKVNATEMIPQAKLREEYEMSSSEKRIYIVSELDETGLAYNMTVFYEVKGGLDKERFEEAVAKLVKRHEPLRTSFHMQGEKAIKIIHDTVDVKVEWETKEEIGKGIVDGFVRPFDLGKAPLFRLKVVEAQGKTYLLTDTSHIISDGGSAQIFIKDLIALYKGEELAPLRVQYKDYSEWMRLVHYEDLKEQKAYWLNEFKDEPMVLNLQTDYPRPAVQSFEGDNYTKDVDKVLSEQIIRYAKDNDITENMLLMGAFALLLSKYASQDDIVIGTPVSGRMNFETEAMMGVFINTLAIRSRIDKTKSVRDYMQQMKDVFVKAYDNQEYPFEDLVDQVVSKRDMSRNPLFDVMFTYYSEQEVNIGTDEDGFVLTDLDEEGKVAQFDITLSVSRFPDTFKIDFEYCTKLFRKDTMMRMADSYLWLLTRIVSDADLTIRELTVVDPATEEKLLTTFNCEEKNYDFGKTLYEKFEEFVLKQPDKTAVIYGETKLSYREINEKANRIAHYLIGKGIKKDDVVGVLLERSPKFIESVLGIWKAGGAYMPLDSKHPVERKLGLLEDSKAFGMITKSAIAEPELIEQFSGNGGKVLRLDDAREILEKESAEDPMLPSDIHQLAYVLFTSGSTGKPKGVMIEHLGMLNHIYAEADDLGLTDDLVFAQNANQCFDVSVWQFFGALALGGTTAIYSNDCILNIPEFIGRLNADGVNMLEVVPSYLSVVMDYVESDHLNIDHVKHLLVTGEAVKPEIVNRWFSLSDKQEIINAYGPAEASDDVVQAHITKPVETTTVPIGKPLPNVNVYILDQDLNLCPIGVEGEICIGGVGVGRGYVNNEEKTREAFVTITIGGRKERIYRTGDKAKWAENGEIIFLGRDDFQVKIRGFRIELEEIEKQIIKVDGVKEVVVMPVEKQLLAAYFVATREVTADEIKRVIIETLPEYMIPSNYVQLDKMPLSSNGKIDRKALPKIDVTENRIFVAPRNELEGKLCRLFEEILNTTGIGIDDSFFDNGGHSLRATSLNNKIGQYFGLRLSLRDIFNHPTVRQLAEIIKQLNLSVSRSDEMKIRREGNLTIQSAPETRKTMYLLSQSGRANTTYNMPSCMLIEEGLDPIKVEKVYQMIVAKHEALRTSFRMEENEIVQIIHDQLQFEIHYEEVEDEQKEINTVIRRFVRPFKLSIAPIFRVKICRLADEKFLLLTDYHKIICDEISREQILTEFMKIYTGEELPEMKYELMKVSTN